jgi:hypothetical protein
MANSIIKGKTRTFTATRNPNATDGAFNGIYDEESGTVWFSFSIRFSTDANSSTPLWTLPEAYRPKSWVRYPVFVITNANSPLAFVGDVSPNNGVINQTASGSCRQAYGVAMYKI